LTLAHVGEEDPDAPTGADGEDTEEWCTPEEPSNGPHRKLGSPGKSSELSQFIFAGETPDGTPAPQLSTVVATPAIMETNMLGSDVAPTDPGWQVEPPPPFLLN